MNLHTNLPTDIPIDKGVPCPIPRRGGRIYPWNRMEVGDSFFTPKDLRRVRAASHSFTSLHPERCLKYTARSVTENGVKGTRIWRTQ